MLEELFTVKIWPTKIGFPFISNCQRNLLTISFVKSVPAFVTVADAVDDVIGPVIDDGAKITSE
jgi:hypothetical protein